MAYGNKLELNAGQTVEVKARHLDGYYMDIHSVELDEETGILKVEVM